MDKSIKDMSYPELVDHAAREIHSGLLKDGGTGLRDAVWLWLGQAVVWNDEHLTKINKG
tara:strand:+ start:204 stop:380 length:177 start_codon:yes stop_codon:yes gene_type:complete